MRHAFLVCLTVICGNSLSCAASWAATVVNDNFSYANNAALQAVWGPPVLGGSPAAGAFSYTTGTGTLQATSLTDSDNLANFGTATFVLNLAALNQSVSGDFTATMKLDFSAAGGRTYGMLQFEARHATGVIASGGVWDDTAGPTSATSGYGYTQIGGTNGLLGPTGNFNANPTTVTKALAWNKGAQLPATVYTPASPGELTITLQRTALKVTATVSGFGASTITGAGLAADLDSLAIRFMGWRNDGQSGLGAGGNHLYGSTSNFFAVDEVTLVSNPNFNQRILSDTQFAPANWSYTVLASSGNSSAAPTQTATGGSTGSENDPFRQMTHTLSGASSSIFAFHGMESTAHDPATQGAILSLDFSGTQRLISGSAVGYNWALEQNGVYYEWDANGGVRPSFLLAGSAWQNFLLEGLTADDFVNFVFNGTDIPAGTLHPDFSESGAPITFGFLRWNRGLGTTFTHAMDNFQVAIHHVAVVPEPSTFVLLAVALVAAGFRLRRPARG